MKSRIVQAVLLLIVFALGVAFWNAGSTPDTTPTEGYVPPAP